MIKVNSLLESIYKRLQAENNPPHRASAIAFDLFVVEFELKRPAIYLEQDLIDLFFNKIAEWNLEDLLIHQEEYAIKIAASEGDLLYEEMHKLFDLCDEVFALKYLGFESDEDVDIQYEQALRRRFEQEKRKARLVAEDKFEDWKAQLWWYSDNLSA